MIIAELSIVDQIKRLIKLEISEFDDTTDEGAATVRAFRQALCEPEQVTANFSGGVTQECWTVTYSNGAYRVLFLPTAGYFSLCVESEIGPLDIGVHGKAIGCFSSV